MPKKGNKKKKKEEARPARVIKRDRRFWEEVKSAKKFLDRELARPKTPEEVRPATPTADDLLKMELEAAAAEEQAKKGEKIAAEAEMTLTGKESRCEALISQYKNSEDIRNTDKELLILEYVNGFRQQFTALYPERRAPFLFPQNEFGISKFVCTTLCSTQVPYKGLYNAESACRFVAGFLEYERLLPAHEPPRHLPSPARVARWQKGDSFDAAMLLCSILLGVGYDAFVVYGYASRDIALKDTRKITCPYLSDGGTEDQEHIQTAADNNTGNSTTNANFEPVSAPPSASEEKGDESKGQGNEEGDDENGGTDAKTAYSMPAKLALSSAFLKQQEDKKREKEQKEIEDAAILLDDPDEEEVIIETGLPYVHAWILIKAGKREVETDLFLDPVSGRQFRTDSNEFSGVEAIWNNMNYWINMQFDEQGLPLDTPISFNLDDTSLWEHVVAHGGEPGDSNGLGHGHSIDTHSKHTHAHGHGRSLDNLDASIVSVGGAGIGGGVNGARKQSNTDGEGEGDMVNVDDHELGVDAAASDESLDLGKPWGEPILIKREAFEGKWPKGKNVTRWSKAITYHFAPYVRSDGMVLRVCAFSDIGCNKVLEIKEVFEKRRDKLKMRVRKPLNGVYSLPPEKRVSIAVHVNENVGPDWKPSDGWSVIESFLPGRICHLKSRWLIGNRVDSLEFYDTARIDGLASRSYVWTKNKIIENFVGREDRLTYRSVSYDADLNASISEPNANPDDIPIRKMTEKFERNNALKAEEDIMKRTYIVGVRIVVVYHKGAGRITQSVRTFSSRDSASTLTSTVVQVDPFAQPPKRDELFDEFQQLLRAEKSCAHAVRAAEKEAADVNRRREEEEDRVELVISVYDTERNKTRGGSGIQRDQEDGAGQKMEHTYLTPFLVDLGGKPPQNEAEALQVYDAAINSLSQVLVEKELLIIQRRDELVNARDRRVTAYQRNLERPDPEEDKAHDQFLAEVEFKIRILDERLARHRDNAFRRIVDLHEKMMKDELMQHLNISDMEDRMSRLRAEHARKYQA